MSVSSEEMRRFDDLLSDTARRNARRSRLGVLRLIREDIACVFERDPAARTRVEVMTTYPGVHAVTMYRLAHPLWHRGWKYTARLLSYIARVWTGIDIHPGARIGLRFFIDHGAGVVIGETAEIGDDVTLYHGVTLGGTTWSRGKRHPTLGAGVVVGAGAKILGPITIGARAKIGANSVVIRSVPERQTVVGIPAKIVQVDRAAVGPHGIDLNHHLIPDPVAGAIACLLDRIRLLEDRLGVHGCLPGGEAVEDECDDCKARQVCDTPSHRPATTGNEDRSVRGVH